jgi:microcystin-dependent protein
MPQHNHAFLASQGAATAPTPGTSLSLGTVAAPDTWYFSTQGSATAENLAPLAVGMNNGNLPHDNCMPTLTVSFCIAWAGVFPTRN